MVLSRGAPTGAPGLRGPVYTPPALTWIPPTLLNGWENYGGAWVQAGYAKDDQGIVHVRGMIRNGTTLQDTVLFNLPAGYRPLRLVLFGVTHGEVGPPSLGRIDFVPDGEVAIVLPDAAANSWLSLANISFST